ncbi:hypothetical protein M9194_19690 [Vibrio sp. S4M6]|uniref:hypothetical protein n=1 Tax=Vibrio sinus TaxID=2946865 RepID=UPI00202A1AAB|nr:hypothetical protein [Vibrio sinus]MCL9783651.1 hypothetical protein [Vibrio sinus]
MNDLFNPDKIYRQRDIAALLKISDRQLRTLISEGFIPDAKPRSGFDPLACVHAYITYKTKSKSSQEKPEVGAGEPELTEEEQFERKEKLLKLEEREEKLAMMKAKRHLFEKSYAPIEIIVDTLQQVGARLASRHDSLIPKMKISYPDLPQAAVEALEAELTAAVNECADILPDLSDYVDSDPESGPSWLVGDEEDSSSHRNGVVR